jgi:hypothetical protein
MRTHNPPMSDPERIASMLAALAALDAEDEDDTTDEEIRAECEARGVDIEAWGAAIAQRAAALVEIERREHRTSGCFDATGQDGPASELEPPSLVPEKELLADGPASANDVDDQDDVPPGERRGALPHATPVEDGARGSWVP